MLDGGRIIGMGTHEELMVSCDVYREIAESQLRAQDLKGGLKA
jgi:ATP-binding cassette subfamily B protein